MLEDDETWALRAGEPLVHEVVHVVLGLSARRDVPVVGIVVPDDRSQPEHALRNGVDAVVDVAVGRAPEAGELSIGRVVDDLHCHGELAEHLHVAEGCHVRVSPGVHCDIVSVRAIRGQELLPVVEDVHANHEMGRLLVVLLEERVQGRRELETYVSKRRTRKGKYTAADHLRNRERLKIDTYRSGSVVKPDSNKPVRRVPNGTVRAARAGATAISGADGRVLAVHALRVGGRAVDEGRLGNVRDRTRGDSRIERIRPGSGKVGRVCRSLRVLRGPG